MALETIYKTVNDNGEYSCGDIGISKEEWFELLKDNDAQQYRDALFCILRMPDNAATCTEVAKKFGNSPKHYNAKIMNFGRWVQRKLNRFQVIGTDGEPTYWCIPMKCGHDTWQGFNWQLRDELVEALRYYLMKALILRFRESEQFKDFDESYKWELLDRTEGKGVLDIVKSLQDKIQGQQVNLVYNAQFNGVMNYLSKNHPDLLTATGEHLFDESKPIDERIATFKAEMQSNCPSDWKNFANDERTASALLMCKYPEKYTTYKDEVYQIVCRYFGFNTRYVGKKFSHFMGIIDGFVADFGEKVQGIVMPYINQYRNKPINLAIQTVFWCMKDYMNEIMDRKSQQKEDDIDPIIEPDMPQQQQKYKEYIELLQETYNLVLTGAPGTGKTYMARAIADEMGAVTMFVQFHPSYDYTDFVEGLRPIEKGDGQMGFERKDGVFKEFCARAISDKSTQAGNIMADSLAPKGISRAEFWSIYNSIVADIQSGRLTSYPTPYKSQSLSVKNGRIVFRADSNNPRTEKESNLKLLYDYFVSLNKYDLSGLDKDDYWNLITTLTNGATKTIDYIEYNWILQEILNRAKQISVKKDQVIVTHPDILDPAVLQSKHNNKKRLRPFVFIIDEINRGEASKIFGELFFAIDPGYRGKTDILVQTQYQNLVPETDVFAKGFYVPENVYILATMNDIDRSVESMDFAMRRRFTWHEITPGDTESMLDELKCAYEAKATMHRLNAAIAETDGLGAAYMIGPAYFLKLKDNGGDFEKLWKMNIQPLLKEYLRGFRKTAEILDKFRKAYFNENSETPADASDLLE